MMKVLHSADWHLGAPMTRWGDDARQALASVPGKIASLVRSQNCDLVLLAGDLFDGPPSPEMIRLFCHALEEMAVPVCIAPGNHDYIAADSFWKTTVFPENVHIFQRSVPESVVLEDLDCRVYGAGYYSMDCPPLLRNFRAEGSERYVLGLFHADPVVRNSPYCPITADQVRESGLDYLALGHIHQTGSFRAGSTLCAWPGCPMGRGYDECGEKGVLLVTLDENAHIQFLPLGLPRFHDLTVSTENDPAKALLEILPPAAVNDYFRITLTGEWEDADPDALGRQFSQYRHLDLIDRTTPPVDLWAETGNDTLEGIYFQMLRSRMEQEPHLAEQIRLAAKLSRAILDGREVQLP